MIINNRLTFIYVIAFSSLLLSCGEYSSASPLPPPPPTQVSKPIIITDSFDGCHEEWRQNGNLLSSRSKGLIWSARMQMPQTLMDASYTGVQAIEDTRSPILSWDGNGNATFNCSGNFIYTAQINVHMDDIEIGDTLDIIITNRLFVTLNGNPEGWFHSGENIRQVPSIRSEFVDSQDSLFDSKAISVQKGDVLTFEVLSTETGDTMGPLRTIETLSYLSIAQL